MIDVQINSKKVISELEKIAAHIENDAILEGVANIVRDGIKGIDGIFDNEGIEGGDGIESILWDKSAAAQRENRKTLRKSGHLRRSIYRTNAKNGEVMVGTDVKYAAIHHFGGEAGRKNKRIKLPKRPFLAIDKKTQESVLEYLKGKLNGR